MSRPIMILAGLLVLILLFASPAPVLGERPCPSLLLATPGATPVDLLSATPDVPSDEFPFVSSAATPIASPGATPVGPSCRIDIEHLDFVPLDVAIPVGTTVIWINLDNRTHGVEILGTGVGPVQIPAFSSYSFTFLTPGTYRYRNSVYSGRPRGTIEVF